MKRATSVASAEWLGTAITCTIIRNNRGPHSKAFALLDGRLQKTAVAELTHGAAIRAAVSDLRQFEAVSLGQPALADASGGTWKSKPAPQGAAKAFSPACA